MRVKFTTKIQGIAIDEIADGATAEEVIKDLRRQIAAKNVRIAFFKVNIGKKVPQLNPDNSGAWSNTEFFKVIVDYHNDNLEDNDAPLSVPTSCEAFIEQCVSEGVAKILEK